jgi:hypothetical protein
MKKQSQFKPNKANSNPNKPNFHTIGCLQTAFGGRGGTLSLLKVL